MLIGLMCLRILYHQHLNKIENMKTIKKTKLALEKQIITKLTEETIKGGYIAIATQSDQQKTGCQTNCQPSNKSFNC